MKSQIKKTGFLSGVILFACLSFPITNSHASETVKVDGKTWKLVNGVNCDTDGIFNLTGGVKVEEKPVFSLALMDPFETSDGSVSFEIKSVARNVKGNNYHGLVFRGVDELNYDVVYLRWRKNDDKLKGIQYVRIIGGKEDFNRYDVLANKPQRIYSVDRKFEDDAWIKVRVDFTGQDMKVFIADEPEPAFHCGKLEPARKGRIGVWSYLDSGRAQIRNVNINNEK